MNHLAQGRLNGRFSPALALAPWLLPTSAARRQMFAVSFDHLVGAREERWWNRETEARRRLEVDGQLPCIRLLDRQVGRGSALKDLSYIPAGATLRVAEVVAVSEHATLGARHVVPLADCRQAVLLSYLTRPRARVSGPSLRCRYEYASYASAAHSGHGGRVLLLA